MKSAKSGSVAAAAGIDDLSSDEERAAVEQLQAKRSSRRATRSLKKRAKDSALQPDQTGGEASLKQLLAFDVNPSDTRFAAIYTSANFNIDPSATEFRDTPGMHCRLFLHYFHCSFAFHSIPFSALLRFTRSYGFI